MSSGDGFSLDPDKGGQGKKETHQTATERKQSWNSKIPPGKPQDLGKLQHKEVQNQEKAASKVAGCPTQAGDPA